MKIILPCFDASFQSGKQSGQINGGTAWLWHLAHTFQDMGHEAELVENGTAIPEADICIIQSEWYAIPGQMERLQELRRKGMKLVVILGHFIGGVYFDPKLIEADLFVSTWQGPVVQNFKQRVHFFPHAYCKICDTPGSIRFGDIVWVGNNYPLRKEDWFEGLDITKVNGVMPNQLGPIYRGAKVCPNIHGEFQMGVVSTEPSRLATEPGWALNERVFQVTGSGGFMVCQEHPQLWEFFEKDELVTAKTPEEFREQIQKYVDNPTEREEFIKKAQKKVVENHTYHHRCAQLLEWLGS